MKREGYRITVGAVDNWVSEAVPHKFHGLYRLVASYTRGNALMQSQVCTCVSLGLAVVELDP